MVKILKNINTIMLLFCGIFLTLTNVSFAKPPEQPAALEYEAIDMEALAEIYWALKRQDIEDPDHLDNYLRITQCSLFTDYFQNEFEWKEIIKATKEHLKENTKTTPLRYEFMQPLKLGEYDIKKQSFMLQEDYQLKGIRRFEVRASSAGQEVCGLMNKVPGYPRAIAVEFNRPVALTSISVPKDLALKYIQDKQELFQRSVQGAKTRSRLMELRDAYIVMKLRFFSSQGDIKNVDGQQLPHILAVLEKIEVYADKDREFLLMSKDLMRRKKAVRRDVNDVNHKKAPISTEDVKAHDDALD